MLLYIHIPFCASKCGYCGFNSLTNMMDFKEKYLDSLCVDLENEIESWQMRVDSANLSNSQNLNQKELCEAPENSPASWCKKSESKGAEVPPADFLLEADKRGSPPKSEKRQLLARRGSGAGGAALLRKETSDSNMGCHDFALQNLVTDKNKFIKFHSIYIGGGTPNTLNPKDYEQIFKILSPRITPNAEITMELNPNASSIETLRAFKDLGVNRFSIGVQSFCADKLRLLERNHSPKIAQKFIENALNCGVKVSIDLIYDTILDNKKSLRFELENAVSFGIGHISCYALSIDKNSAFYAKHKRPLLESSLCYELKDFLESRGFTQYEVSNFAREHKSAHNLGYWAYRDYIGIGLGAVGKRSDKGGVYRTYKSDDFGAYLANPSAFRREFLSQSDIRLEKIFLGFRSEVGVESALIADKKRLDLLIKSGKVFAKHGKIFAKKYFIADELALWVG